MSNTQIQDGTTRNIPGNMSIGGWVINQSGGANVDSSPGGGPGAGPHGFNAVPGGAGLISVTVPSGYPATVGLVLTVENPSGGGGVFDVVNTPVNPPAPPAPTNVQQVTNTPPTLCPLVSWNASAGADSYQIQTAAAPGGPFTTLSTVSGTSAPVCGGGSQYIQIVPMAAGVSGTASAPPLLVSANANAPGAFGRGGLVRHARFRR